jgi:hypothetical protein
MLLEIVFSRWKENGFRGGELLLLCSKTPPSSAEVYFNSLIYCNFKEIGRLLPVSAGSRICGNHFCRRLEADMTVRRVRGGIGAAQAAAASPEAAATASCSREPMCSVACQPLRTASPQAYSVGVP